MTLQELAREVAQIMGPDLAAGFTGRFTFDVDCRQGGIAKVSVRKEHDLRARTSQPGVTRGAYREDRTPPPPPKRPTGELMADGFKSRPSE